MHFLVAFFGSLLYNFGLFKIAKDKYDEGSDQPFPYKAYFLKNWDNWAFASLCTVPLVLYLTDIVAIINAQFNLQLQVYEAYYLGAGPLSELISIGIFRLLGFKKSIVQHVNKDQ